MATSNTKLEDIILRAVDIVASQKVAKAGYDKTIQATVVSCIDETIGKYKVKYQDSYWIAYSNNVDNYYAPNSNVYILIPNGDMSKDKTILGTTRRLGANYISIAQEDQKYTPVGSNIISNIISESLCSYKTETKILYSSDYSDQQNSLSINNDIIKEYIQNSTSIIASIHVKNNLNIQQRFQGNYGILFGLDFLDNATDKTITRYYSIDIDNMNGNPYYYPNEVRQYNIFDIDGKNFEKVNMIALFTKDFPVQNDEMPDDIFISNIELCGAVSLQDEDLNSCALVLLTPKGYIFTKDSAETDTRTLQAELRVKGKVIDINSQNVDFYWFTENLSITAASPKYNKYGGQGWECLNNYQIIQDTISDGTVTTPAVYQFIAGSNIFSVKKSDILARSIKYKCVAIYDNMVLSKQAKIVRYDSNYDIQITSSQGTQFYNNIGNTTLTCICKQKNDDGSFSIVNTDDLKFVWGSINNIGNFNSLVDTLEYNEDKNKLISIKDAINEYIQAEYILYQTIYNVDDLLPDDTFINNIINTTQKEKITNAKLKLINAGLTTSSDITNLLNKYNVQVSNLTYKLVLDGNEDHENSLKTVINNYNFIQRVIENRIEGIQVSNITKFLTFKCSVFSKVGNIFLGSSSITLTNSLDSNLYTLIINNNTQIFKYNTHGVSPASRQNKEPQEILALSFTIYDNSGNEISAEALRGADITWIAPNNNTLLRFNNYTDGIVSSDLETISYKNLTSFAFSIAENYNVNYTRNNIELKVQYNGLTLFAKTNLSFLKQGENSTNGTDFVCKIVPNVLQGDVPINPTIYYDGSNISFNWNTDTTTNKWFKAQLWHNGVEPIFENTESANSTEGKFVTVVKWEVLKNIYAYNKADSTNLNAVAAVSNSDWSFSFSPGVLSSDYTYNDYLSWLPANIIKVTLSYDGMTYYATLPVIVCRIFNNNYKVKLKDYSGFREVLYNASGESPQYDSHSPFEILTSLKVGNNQQDISTKTFDDYKLGYEWYYLGSVWNKANNGTWTEDAEVTLSSAQDGESSKKWLSKRNLSEILQSNQKSIKPADNYSGQCVNTALACRVYLFSSNTTIAWIHIPIHMMRNRFENSAINGWDGNSVNLGGENGGMILAPQVGAGIKDNNNRFTGIFIGTAKDPQEDLSNEENNTGNSAQGRFASTNEDVGLFGYNEGSRSIFLDAKTGKAVFGQTGQAQIILDPTQTNSDGRKVAQIKSGNYNTTNKTGLLIDLSTPEIKYGSGNFQVDADGHMIAKGGGEIAGWEINNTAIFNKRFQTSSKTVFRNTTGMNSNPIPDPTSTSINNTGNGSEYRQIIRMPVTKDQGTFYKDAAAAFWAGDSKFFVTHEGYLQAQEAVIGSGSQRIYIGKGDSTNSAIFSGLKATKNESRNGFYLGTDGLGIGTTKTIKVENSNGVEEDKVVSNFQVDRDGTFYANNGIIEQNVKIKGRLSAANIITGTINNKTVDWATVWVVTGITAITEQRKWMSDLRKENGRWKWKTYNGQSVIFIDWATTPLTLLVNAGTPTHTYNNKDINNYDSEVIDPSEWEEEDEILLPN